MHQSDWEVACSHLRQTLKSVQNSSNGNYCVVVAGHEAPDFDVGLFTISFPTGQSFSSGSSRLSRFAKAGQVEQNRSRLGLREVNMHS